MKKNNLKGSAILCLTALIWGIAFVAQSDGGDKVPPFTFNALRSVVATAALCIFYFATGKGRAAGFFPKEAAIKKEYLKGGLTCGALLCTATAFQQIGINAYPAGAAVEARSGFITALYVVLVPLFMLAFGKKSSPAIYISALTAIAGFYMLCFFGGIGRLYTADLLVLLSSLCFAGQIIAVDKFVTVTGGLKLSVMQFAVTALLSAAVALIFERPSLESLVAAAPQLLYLGLVSSGIGYTLQIIGQKYAEPAVASLSMSLESVFAALGGWLISGNRLSPHELIGCALVFAAIIMAQIPEIRKKQS